MLRMIMCLATAKTGVNDVDYAVVVGYISRRNLSVYRGDALKTHVIRRLPQNPTPRCTP